MQDRFRIHDLRFKNGLFVAILILTAYFLLPATIFAADPIALSQQIEQVRREREALLAEQARLQAELDKVNAQSRSLGTAVKSLDTTRKKLATDIKVTQSKISSTNLNIRSLENTMADKERQIETHHSAIGLALQALSDYDSRSLLLNILASGKLSDLWQDKGRLEDLNARLKEEVGNLRETKTILSQEKNKKEEDKEKILGLQAQLSGQKGVVEESQKAKERLLAESKNQEAAYQRMLVENLARQKEFEEDLSRLESELKITLDPSLIPTARAGILSWPFDAAYMAFCESLKNQRDLSNSKCVTQTFGRTSFSSWHNGVDFRAAMGTPVMAIFAGEVRGVGNTDEQRGCYSYGRWILVRHGNGLTSVYAHLSASLAKVGQNVKAGEVIGYSGGQRGVNGSGFSTAPHLHLGLFASQGVEIRPFTSERYLTTGSGCHGVNIPVVGTRAYLNPLAYLPAL